MNGTEQDYYQTYLGLIRSQLAEEQRRQQEELSRRMSQLAPWGGAARIPTAEISRQYATGMQQALGQLALGQMGKQWQAREAEKQRAFQSQQLQTQIGAQTELTRLQEQLARETWEMQQPSGWEQALQYLMQALGLAGGIYGGAKLAKLGGS